MIRDRIPYETLVQGALRDVIRQVLTDVAAHGLPGEHHFYITFQTHLAGVEMSARLKERYPDHVTIVLQNQFWDLAVDEDKFSVTLSFSDVPERLVVPFVALQAFYDPVASFEASFDIVPQIPSASAPVTVFAPKTAQEALEQTSNESPDVTMEVGVNKQNQNVTEPLEVRLEKNPTKSADVVSLDAFRKK